MSKFDVTCEFREIKDSVAKRLTIKNDSWGDVFLRIEEGEKCVSFEVNGDELILAIKHCMESEVK